MCPCIYFLFPHISPVAALAMPSSTSFYHTLNPQLTWQAVQVATCQPPFPSHCLFPGTALQTEKPLGRLPQIDPCPLPFDCGVLFCPLEALPCCSVAFYKHGGATLHFSFIPVYCDLCLKLFACISYFGIVEFALPGLTCARNIPTSPSLGFGSPTHCAQAASCLWIHTGCSLLSSGMGGGCVCVI